MSDILRQLLANPLYAGMGGQPQQSPMSGMKLADALDMFGKMNGKMPAGMTEQNAVAPGGLSGAVAGINALQPAANGQWTPPPMPALAVR